MCMLLIYLVAITTSTRDAIAPGQDLIVTTVDDPDLLATIGGSDRSQVCVCVVSMYCALM